MQLRFSSALIVTIISGILMPGTTVAADADFSLSGFAAADLRVFPRDRRYDDQREQTFNPSMVLQPELTVELHGGDDLISFTPYGRIDGQDSERSHFDVRELSWLHIGDGWDVTAGVDKVYWGVTESRHLVDIINQTDGVEDVDGEEKLGQPMINLGLQQDWGDVNLFVLPYFRERTFTGRNGRLRGSTPVDNDQSTYDSRLKQRHPDIALRYSGVIDEWDIGIAHFYGTGREPRFKTGTDSSGQSVLVPHYDIINQTSLDIQATFDAWLLKSEMIYRSGQGKDFAAISAGFEYTFFGLVGEAGDLGVLAEYHYDGRDSTAPLTGFDNDLFAGLRLTLNDVNDTDFLVGILVDRITQSRSLSVEVDTRLSDNLTLDGQLRISDGLTEKDPAFGARSDNHLQLRLSYYY